MNFRRKSVLLMVLTQTLYVLLYFTQPVASIPIDNEVVGPINISCVGSGVVVNFKTKNTFEGRVYLRGPSENSDCPTEVGHVDDAGVFVLPFTDCNMRKRRLAGESGDEAPINMVTISFHPLGIITEADRAFKVECRDQSLDLMLTQSFEVSMLPTEASRVLRPQSSCTYTIRAWSLQGPIVKFANVGDTVFHIWECRNDEYAMFVHSCFASSRNESEIPLVDQSGCSLDRYIMSNLTYSENMLRAYAYADVFKFMDLSNLSFKCKVELCHKTDINCTSRPLSTCASVEQTTFDTKDRKSRDAPTWPSSTSPIDVNSQELFINELKERADDFLTKSDQQSSVGASAKQHVPVESESYCASWCTMSNVAVITGLVIIAAIASFLLGCILSHLIPIRRVYTKKCQAEP
uniref:ZP domain-containing protein n=1 Tax=Plectus sambesii TaxID=2011161 RepID=A0A914X8G3_9BILA